MGEPNVRTQLNSSGRLLAPHLNSEWQEEAVTLCLPKEKLNLNAKLKLTIKKLQDVLFWDRSRPASVRRFAGENAGARQREPLAGCNFHYRLTELGPAADDRGGVTRGATAERADVPKWHGPPRRRRPAR